MATEATKQDSESKRSFWRRTRLYLLEYCLYQVFLVILLSYIAYTFYSLFWGVAGKPFNLSLVQANVWFMAGGFVFAPVAYLLHTRTRWEEVTHPARHAQGLRQAIMYIQLVVAIIAGLTFLLVGVINLLRVAVGLTDTSTLLTIAIPSLINAVITTIVILDIFTKQSRRSLKVFRPIFFGVCILVNIILLVITMGYGRSARYDLTTMRDLKTIHDQVLEKYYESGQLTTDLQKLDLADEIEQRAAQRQYTVTVTNSRSNTKDQTAYGSGSGQRGGGGYYYGDDTRYELCATFRDKVDGVSQSPYNFAVEASHGSGYQCFEMVANY